MKSKKLDQFYTNPLIAKICLKEVETYLGKRKIVYLEPAAGTGSFSNLIKNVFSIDLDPKNKKIKKGDFLLQTYKSIFGKKINSKNVCSIGNPPFGKNSSLAIKFFNHAAKMSDTIAFILPKTFRKKSIQNKLNKNFWLVKDLDLPKNSFIHNNQQHDTPCCFQIWEKRDEERVVLLKKESNLFDFVKKENADFAVRRVGGRSGKAISDFRNCATVSHYFIKVKKGTVEELLNKINNIDFSKEINSTAGVRSLSKSELIEKIEE